MHSLKSNLIRKFIHLMEGKPLNAVDLVSVLFKSLL